jgi:HEAT repeat protein
MIAFCTHCWAEIEAALDLCPNCGADLALDSRTYGEKLVAALAHPLPEARVRICWLIGENGIRLAVPDLIRAAEDDPDLFVQKAALESLAVLRDSRSIPLLLRISESDNRFLAATAKKSLCAIEPSTNSPALERGP